MLDIFDILGPVMVGPSSSHTAGAVRIGRMARTLLGGEPVRAKIGLYGSFAETGQGHGTDKALVAGLLGSAWSLVIIAIAWIRFRPVLGFCLLGAALALVILLFIKGRMKKANPASA